MLLTALVIAIGILNTQALSEDVYNINQHNYTIMGKGYFDRTMQKKGSKQKQVSASSDSVNSRFDWLLEIEENKLHMKIE